MKKLGLAAGAALLASTAMVQAGGIERTNQSVDIIFEEGTLVEFGASYAMPSVSGVDPATTATGIMSPNYASFSGGYKTDIGSKVSLAVIFDQPFGSLAEYTTGFYNGTKADLTSSAITVVGSYDVSDRFMVYGGATYQTMQATAAVPLAGYTINAASDSGFGYVLGAAYQIPDIAMRVALTYRSSVTTTHATVETGPLPGTGAGSMSVTTPQSVNLEFQTGVNPKTLVFGSIRWVNWSAFDLTPNSYPGAGGALINYTDDRVTYNLGVGRKLSDTLSAALTLGYERDLGGASSALGPTDGFFSLGGGLTYTMGNAKISAGAKYIWLGDTTGPKGTFSNNSAIGVGINFSIAM
jgi:long-subunit fatty acid transport protein